MSMTIEGTVQRSPMGAGTWAIAANNGTTYEIHKGAPADLLQNGLKVKATGKIREDVMTVAMIGPVFEVEQFEAVD